MNPFVNVNKRSVLLPSGCKDLVDVLLRPHRSPEREAQPVGQLETSIAQERFQTAGLARLQKYIAMVVASSAEQAVLGIQFLDGRMAAHLLRFAGAFDIYPRMGSLEREKAVEEFFSVRGIQQTVDYWEGHPGMPSKVLGFPLPAEVSGAFRITLELMQAIYGLDDQMGLEYVYAECQVG